MTNKKSTINQIVEKGYDQIAQNYLQHLRSGSDANRHTIKYLKLLTKRLPANSKILDVGCGAGIPATQFLAQNHKVTGVDISAQQIKLARRNVPSATFIQSNMLNLNFPPASFDAIVSLYAIIHVPRQHHLKILKNLFTFLKPSGFLLITMGTTNTPNLQTSNWLGAPMYWSFFDKDTNLKLIKQAGFNLIISQIEHEHETTGTIPHLYVLAQKPAI